jgi:hypothetical protein
VTSVQAMTVDDSFLYFSDGTSTINRIAVGGGAVQPVAQGQGNPRGLVLDGSYLYWGNQLGGAVVRTAKDGSGSVQTVAVATEPLDIAVLGDDLYWIDQSTNVMKARKTGGAGTVAAPAPSTPLIGSFPGKNASLISTPTDVWVLYARTYPWSVLYSVGGALLTGASLSAGIPSGLPGLAQDGSHVYFSQGDSCFIEVGGTQSGCIGSEATVGFEYRDPRAANSCGVFFLQSRPRNGTDHRALQLGRLGEKDASTLLSVDVDHAAASADYLYFHSVNDNAVGKLPLP